MRRRQNVSKAAVVIVSGPFSVSAVSSRALHRKKWNHVTQSATKSGVQACGDGIGRLSLHNIKGTQC